MENKVKKTLAVLQAHSLRDIVDTINSRNATDYPILRDDIVSLLKGNEEYLLLYYK